VRVYKNNIDYFYTNFREIKEEQEIIFLDSGLETEGDGMESSRQRVRVRLSDASNGSTTSNKPICGGEEKTNPWWRRESKCVEKRKQINHQPERRSSSADVELDPNPGSSRQMASTKRAQNAEHRDSSRSHQKQQSTGPVVVDTHLQQLMTSYRDDIIRKPHSQRRRNHIQTAPADSSTQDSQQVCRCLYEERSKKVAYQFRISESIGRVDQTNHQRD
jgi:hypothetical protein